MWARDMPKQEHGAVEGRIWLSCTWKPGRSCDIDLEALRDLDKKCKRACATVVSCITCLERDRECCDGPLPTMASNSG